MQIQIFQYTETNRRPWLEQVARHPYGVAYEVEEGTLTEMIEQCYQKGLSTGSQRSGVCEVQTPEGYYSHHNPVFRDRGYGKLDFAKAVFTTWEQWEAALTQ